MQKGHTRYCARQDVGVWVALCHPQEEVAHGLVLARGGVVMGRTRGDLLYAIKKKHSSSMTMHSIKLTHKITNVCLANPYNLF